MLFYFAPANYLYLFMTPPQASWVSWRLLLRAVIPLAGLTVLIQPSLGYLHSAHDPQPYFNPNNVAAVPVSSLVPEQLFGFPGLTLDLDLAEAHQLVNGACCHLHPAWLAWDHMPPLQPLLTFMMSALGAQCSGIDEVIAAPWQWAQNFSNPGDWSMVVPQVLLNSKLHLWTRSCPYLTLLQHCHRDWTRVWGFLSQILLILPVYP